MQCTQLIRLVKNWYLHVKEETMAPARMLQFADQHIKNCAICLQDATLMEEIEKIREYILPETKIPKSERNNAEAATPEISPEEENGADDKNEFEKNNDDLERDDED